MDSFYYLDPRADGRELPTVCDMDGHATAQLVAIFVESGYEKSGAKHGAVYTAFFEGANQLIRLDPRCAKYLKGPGRAPAF